MAGQASRENGKKGGRPKGYSQIQAEKARALICEKLEKEFTPIIQKAIDQAKDGDRFAREWLFDRAYGKIPTLVETPEEGNILFVWQSRS